MAVILTLGPILFTDFEIPTSINFGGAQVLAKHRLIGGQRIIDAMGPDDDDIKWSGRLRGGDAEFRAQYLDSLRNSGAVQPLQWSGFRYKVVISDFKANYRQPTEIDYSISCTIVQASINPILQALFTVDSAVGTSLNQALQIAALLNLPGITTVIAAVQSATASVQSYEGLASNAAAGTMDAITGAQSLIESATSTADLNTGNILASAGSNVSSLASSLTSQASSLFQASSLRNLNDQLGTMAKNIGSAVA